jgi:hypothetical protein
MIKDAVSVQLYSSVKTDVVKASAPKSKLQCPLNFIHKVQLIKSPLFCKKGTAHKTSGLQKQDGSVLYVTNAWRGKIPPTGLGFPRRQNCHLFTYHTAVVPHLLCVWPLTSKLYVTCDQTCKWQQSVMFTVNELILMPLLEHYITLPLIKRY